MLFQSFWKRSIQLKLSKTSASAAKLQCQLHAIVDGYRREHSSIHITIHIAIANEGNSIIIVFDLVFHKHHLVVVYLVT